MLLLAPVMTIGQIPDTQPAGEPEQFEREVMEYVRSQPVGKGTVGDLNLSEEFLRRVSDRALRASYEQRFRIVVPDQNQSAVSPSRSVGGTATSQPSVPGTAPPTRSRVFWGTGLVIPLVLITVAIRRGRRKRL